MLKRLVDVDNVTGLGVLDYWQVKRSRKNKPKPLNPVTVFGETYLVKTPKYEAATPVFMALDERRINISPVLVTARVTDFAESHLK